MGEYNREVWFKAMVTIAPHFADRVQVALVKDNAYC